MHTKTMLNELNGFQKQEPKSKISPKRKWKCALATMNIDEYVIVPLTSIKLLKSEGYHMNNCCKDYAQQCVEGEYCVFSIRDISGNRVATLGAINNEGYWRFDQCFGNANANVTSEFIEHLDSFGRSHMEWSHTELYYVASEVIRLLNVPSTH